MYYNSSLYLNENDIWYESECVMKKMLISLLLLVAHGVHANSEFGPQSNPSVNSAGCQASESSQYVIDGCREDGTFFDKSKDSWTTPGLEERSAELCGEVSRYAWLAVVFRDKGWTLEDEISWALDNLEPGEFRNLIILAASEAYVLYNGAATLEAVKNIAWPRCMNYSLPAS